MTDQQSSTRRHVVVLTHEYAPFPGGEATYAAGVIDGLCELNCDVEVVAPDYGTDLPDSLQGVVPAVPTDRLLRHQKLDAARVLTFARRYVFRSKSTLYLAGEIRAGLILAALSLVFPVRFAVMFHGSELAKAQDKLQFRLAAAFVVARAAGLCTNSRATLDLLRALRHDDKTMNKSRVVYLGLDPYWFDEQAPESGQDASWSLAGLEGDAASRAVVTTVGRIEPRKGQLFSIDIVERAQALTDTPIKHVIVGRTIDEPYAKAVTERAMTSPADVDVAGSVSRDRLRALYRVSQALLLPGRTLKGKFEGFGLVYIEAASQGCPSLGSRIGGVEDAVAEGVSGFLFEETDLDGMAQRLAEIIGDKDLRESLRQSCYDHARRYSWRECAKRTLEVLT